MPTINPANPKEVILSILNQSSGTAVEVSDVDFGVPQRATGGAPLRNTKLVISPKSNSGYYGNKVIWYNRIHISELGTITVNKGTSTLYSQLIPAINTKYGIYLSVDDIVDGPLPVGQSGQIAVTLSINPSSLMFYSGAKIITPGFNPGLVGNVLTPAIWDSLIKSNLITITPTDFEIGSAAGISMIRTTTSFSTGKRYFELVNNSQYGIIGFGTVAATTNALLGSNANSWALDTYSGLVSHGGATILDLSSQVSLMGNLPIGFMLDLDAKELTLVLSGNLHVPVTGLTLPNEAIFVMAGNKSNTNAVNNIRANFGNESFIYNIPFGYYPGFGSGGAPIQPTAGSLISEGCNGADLMGVYANGNGGTYTAVIQANSPSCGGVSTTPPSSTTTPTSTAPGTTAPPSSTPAPPPTTTITLDATTATVDENGIAMAGYTLTPSINENVLLEAYIVKDTTTDIDYGVLQYQIGAGAWTDMPVSNLLTVSANATTFNLRTIMVEDSQTEGPEAFDIHVSKQPSSTNVLNTTALTKTFTVNDTSIFVPTIPQVHEQISFTNSGMLIIPAGVLEAIISGKGETGVSAVVDNLVDGSPLYFRKAVEADPAPWRGVAVKTDGTLAIRVKENGQMQSTTDGETWTNLTAPAPAGLNGNIRFFSFVNGYFYIFGTGNGYRSIDGSSWTPLTGLSIYSTNYKELVFGNGKYFLNIDDGGAYGVSTDGIAFTFSDFATDFGSNFSFGPTSTIFANGEFVGTYLNDPNSIIVSTDLTSWTKRNTNLLTGGGRYRQINYFNNLFIVSDVSGVAETQYQTSPDAVTWSDEFFPGGLNVFKFKQFSNILYAESSDGFLKFVSTNGFSWDEVSSSYEVRPSHLFYMNGKYRSVGYNTALKFIGDAEPVNTVAIIDPAITGDTATIELLGVTHTYPGSADSTPATLETDIIPLGLSTDTTVTYVAPAGTTATIDFFRDEANCLLVANPTNAATAVVAEGTQAVLIYSLEKPLERNVNFTFNVVMNTLSVADISFIEYSIGTGSYVQVSDGDIITVPIGQTNINVRITALTDFNIETDETLTIQLTKEVGTTVVLNTLPLTQTVTITDVVNNNAVLIMPTWMNIGKANQQFVKNIDNRSLVQFAGMGAAYSRNSVTTGKYYFELKDFPYLYDFVIGVATTGQDIYASLSGGMLDPDRVRNGWFFNPTAHRLHIPGIGWQTLTGTPSVPNSSTVYGFALDIGAKTLQIFQDNVSIHNRSLVYQDTNSIDIDIYPSGSELFLQAWNLGSNNQSLVLNTGNIPFTYTAPAGYSEGFGNELTYLDDYENNNKNFVNGTPVASLFDIRQDANADYMGSYSSTTNRVSISFGEFSSRIDLLPNTRQFFKDYRLTIDMSYQDGAETNPGVEWDETHFRFITYNQDVAADPLVLAVYNRLSDGTQAIAGGSTYNLFPSQSISGVARITPFQASSLPFSGRHIIEYEVVSLPTGKQHTFKIDGTTIVTGTDTLMTKDDTVSTHLSIGWGGPVDIFSYKVENITPDPFETKPFDLTVINNYSRWYLTNNAVLDDNIATYNSYLESNFFTNPGYMTVIYGKWYWEITVNAIPGDSQPATGIAILPGSGVFDPDLDISTLTTVHDFAPGALSVNDVIGVFFDADNGVLEIKVNNASVGIIQNIQLTNTWTAIIGDTAATATTTFTANFGASAFTYSPPSSYNLGIGETLGAPFFIAPPTTTIPPTTTAPPAILAKFWRIVFPESAGGSGAGADIWLDEVTFRDSSLNDISVGGTAFASSEFAGGYDSSLAFDKLNTTNGWSSAPGQFPCWIGYEFDVSKTVDVIDITLPDIDEAEAAADEFPVLASMYFEYSTNGIVYTSIPFTLESGTLALGNTLRFTKTI